MRGIQAVSNAGLFALFFVIGSAIVSLGLVMSVRLDLLATPTRTFKEEITIAVALFLLSIGLAEPAKDRLNRYVPSLGRLLGVKVRLPRLVRGLGLVLLIWGSFVFAFYSLACVLGGYNGYGYSFSKHPFLPLIYNHTIGLLPYFPSLDKGTQAFFFFGLAILGLIALRLDRGIGTAVRDSITLLAAPAIVMYELGLWSSAPEDMTWHVTDFLWMGGNNDGGYRALDTAFGWQGYIFSNWLVLSVALLLVASRIPWSLLIRRSFGGERGAAPSDDELKGPAGRNFSADGAFEPTTLRFLWPE